MRSFYPRWSPARGPAGSPRTRCKRARGGAYSGQGHTLDILNSLPPESLKILLVLFLSFLIGLLGFTALGLLPLLF